MNYLVRESNKKEDMDYFFWLSFETMKQLRRFIYDELVKDNPDASNDELFELHKKETEDYFDFGNPNARIFIAEREDGIRCGYLWMGLRNSQDDWDLERPQWIYDIVVESKFQGKGIGKELMQKAESFARDSKVNIGLFVHSDNESAIALYNKIRYCIKVVPISKKLEEVSIDEIPESGIIVKDEIFEEKSVIQGYEYELFQKKVRFSLDANDETIKKRYEEHSNRLLKETEKHMRLVAVTSSGELIGSIWVGPSSFSEKVAMIFELVIIATDNKGVVGEALIDSAEKRVRNKGYSTLYMLLHAEDELDMEFFEKRGYIVSGFFMEKRVKS